jgi:perosamine synthetase
VYSSIRDAMQLINEGERGICFVLRDRLLVGVVSDGDIRRALLRGSTLDCGIEEVMCNDFFSLEVGSPIESIQKGLELYKCIPITNDDGELVDLATAKSYHQIPLVKPELTGNELAYVTSCIQDGWISSQGKYVPKFEEEFGKYVGSANTIAVSNGTVALHLALVALGIGSGDEVIVPDLTFAATVNAVLYTGATPVLVDVDPVSMAMKAEHVTDVISTKTRAIIPVHIYGYPADLEQLLEIAKLNNLLVIEDCAEALGTFYRGAHVGTFGDAAIFSFFGNKTITTGEGGMAVFSETIVYEKARVLRDHGMSPHRRYWHEQVGFNYRMTNMQAAIGVAQLENINRFVDKKRWLAATYERELEGIDKLCLPREPPCSNSQNSFWLYTVVLLPEFASKRDVILEALHLNGIDARPVFYPMHRMPPYASYACSDHGYENADYLSDAGISLPSSISITEKEIIYVCDKLQAALER